MAKIKIDLSEVQEKLDSLLTPMSRSELKNMGDEMVDEMQDLISKGISPIRGGPSGTRFAGYKNPSKYPGKRKSARPVNLKLTGDMLSDLRAKITSSKDIEIGYPTRSERVKEEGHREGVKGQPKRPTIPEGRERFAARIEKIIDDNLDKAIRKRIR